ncbi:MAG TPA: carboxypeptidase-like regulatory domain-containing protein [Methylomirabilota bacterium]|nr:carboxypeptidase-like regulatory domain-containing protein [Methylomirabilota bacterium]
MKAWVSLVALFFTGLTALAPAWPQDLEGWDRYLDRPRGPYRAQVVDADSKAPLVGAVVVALWRRDHIYPFHIGTENHAVREVVTDSDGRFLLDATDVERGAPRRTRKPEFLIFKAGYGSFPRFQRAPRGFTGGIFEGKGVIIELPRLESRDERRRQLLTLDPHSLSDRPSTDLPILVRQITEESLAVGLGRYPQEEKD